MSPVCSLFYTTSHHQAFLMCVTLLKAQEILNKRQNSCPYDMYILVGKPDHKYINKQIDSISGGDVCDEEKLRFSILDEVIRESFFEVVTLEQRLNKVRESARCDRRKVTVLLQIRE